MNHPNGHYSGCPNAVGEPYATSNSSRNEGGCPNPYANEGRRENSSMNARDAVDLFRRLQDATTMIAQYADDMRERLERVENRVVELGDRVLDLECEGAPSFEELMAEITARLDEVEEGI